IAYAFTFDAAYALTLRQRFHMRHRAYAGWNVYSIAWTALLMASIAGWLLTGNPFFAGLLAFLIFLLVFLVFSRARLFRRRVSQSPFFGEAFAMECSEAGFSLHGTQVDTKATWAIVTRAIAFTDGLLLLSGPQQARWLPDACLTRGSPEQVRALIRGQVVNYRSIGFPKLRQNFRRAA
ncbi:MAG TPA: hypothetical protein VK753_14065, partial [Xanthomonadaceae bacterium]|nr:hypothetical protein [Xanthomonadaceae bacterium]